MLPALVGTVIHRALEEVLGALHARGCTGIDEPRAVEAMRALGGFSKLVEETIDSELENLQSNPRAADRIPTLRTDLRKRVPEMRQRIQAVMSRTRLEADPSRGSPTPEATGRGPLRGGSHPEVDLRAEELRFMGRADLITVKDHACTVTDYKTGAPDEQHAAQVRTYALLWNRDGEVNPSKLPVEQLVLSYATHDELLDAPTDAELSALEDEIIKRIGRAESEIGARPPPARPALDMCRFCSVRHMCDDYWASPTENAVPDSTSRTGDFVDCEVAVGRRNGQRSWVVELDAERERALLRTASEAPGFSAGDRIRVLGAAFGRDADSSEVILTMTQFSEVFVVAEPRRAR